MRAVPFSACEHALRHTFGLTEWRRGQKAAVRALTGGRDLIAIFPTGAGKSLCYQLPAVVQGGLTLVVSPLIALMQDQVRHLRAREIPAALLCSQQSEAEKTAVLSAVRQGDVRLLYVSPERLFSADFAAVMQELPPWLLVVDEAHCVARWGESFRPEYDRIGEFAASLPRRPVLCALTATADRAIRRTICRSLGLRHPRQLTLPALRENLQYRVHFTTHRSACALREAANRAGERGIIYCTTRRRTEALAALLQRRGHAALAYHAGFSAEERLRIQQAFEDGSCRIACATIAFGMGIDLPDIRWILHDGLPQDLTDYAQQTGRAGRDGQPAVCTLLISPGDLLGRIGRLTAIRQSKKAPLLQRCRKVFREKRDLKRLLRVLFTNRCIPAALAAGFGQRVKPCGICSACRRSKHAQLPRFPVREKDRAGQAYRLLRAFRAELADSRSCTPQALLPDRDLLDAVQFGRWPTPADSDAEAARLLSEVYESIREAQVR